MEEEFERFLNEHKKRTTKIVDEYIALYQNSTDEKSMANLAHYVADNVEDLVAQIEESGNYVLSYMEPINPTADQVYNIQEVNRAARVKWGKSYAKMLEDIENA